MDLIAPSIDAYTEAHTTAPPPALVSLAEETTATMGPFAMMMVGHVEGRFLEMLVFALRPQLVLEVGTFTGYSSISMASALPSGGRLVTCDINPEAQEAARRHAAAAGVADRIEYRLGPALETIATIDGPIDLVFIDADKRNYINYYEAVLPKLSAGGIIAADNTLWSGRVLDEAANDGDTKAIRQFNDHVVSDGRVIAVQLSVRDGVTLVRKA